MKMKSCAAIAVLIAACIAAPVVCAQAGGYHRIVTPDDLQWVDIGSLPPGAKIAVIEGNPNSEGMVAIRIKLPPNYRVPPHYHSTLERSTIMSGTLMIGMGDKFDMQKTSVMPAGTVLLMPPNMAHYAWTKDEVIFQLNVMGPWTVTYVNPADDPRKK
jgi:quercetin dioxygenase-like cupin family protein